MAAVSVALCTYQGERFLAEQLHSILAQTHPVAEIVLSDDGSTDRTLEIAREIAATTSVPFVFREHARLGVAGNFADAISATTGDIVALCDQDDLWVPDRLERLVPLLDEVALVHTDATLIDADGLDLGPTLLESIDASAWERDSMANGNALAALLRRNLVTGATTLVRRDAALRALPVPEGWIHDEWLAMLCAIDGGVRLVAEPLVGYRQHGANEIGVEQLSLRGKFQRLVEPDSGAHNRKALRATSLAAEAARRGLGTPAQQALFVEKARHERTRASLPDSRIRRIPAVLRGAVRGRYSTFSRGMLDIARDLLERH